MTNIPSFQEIQPKLLLVLNSLGGSATSKEVIQELEKVFELTEDMIELRHKKSGVRIFDNNCSRARQHLKIKGFLKENSNHGLRELSDEGKKIIPEIDKINFKVSNNIDAPNNDKEIEELLIKEEKNNNISIITKIQSLDPYQFERLCAIIFKKLGYDDVDYTKKSGDGGIDGIGYISFGLVKFRVVLQAKKYGENTKVDEPTVREFLGAIQDHNADKGVIISTGDFTRKAHEFAKKHGIEIVDGEKLINILQKNEIGFKVRIEYDFDEDFFKAI